MPSIIQGYEYDIFISYRHNDNRSGWVTEFVKSLQQELAATIKDPISVYFDVNPHDGLLETHHVDKSLEGKLKCLIFIPILSQTYCDPKSFAWQHEFSAFNKLSREDRVGRDVKLVNGNVASRILPIKIHDLDDEDRLILEGEIGGVLRAIDFIFKSQGVNRPLSAYEDHPADNLNKLFYRDQINKVANAIKELIAAMKRPEPPKVDLASRAPVEQVRGKDQQSTSGTKQFSKKRIALATFGLMILLALIYGLSQYIGSVKTEPRVRVKSIAVLPFADMSSTKDQEYFSDGLSDELITLLAKVPDLKVIGRTSSFFFKGKNVDLRTIGEKLNVSNLLEGSVQRSGNRIRIIAQLINSEDGSHLWSETYDREMDDIFKVQDEIAEAVTEALKVTLLDKVLPARTRLVNPEAYNLFLRGKFFYERTPIRGPDNDLAMKWFKESIAIDSMFALSWTYYGMCKLRLTLSTQQSEFKDARRAVEKAMSLDPTSGIAATNMAEILDNEYDLVGAENKMKIALALSPNDPYVLRNMGRVYTLLGRKNESIEYCTKALQIDPIQPTAMVYMINALGSADRLEEANVYITQAKEQGHQNLQEVGVLFRLGKFDDALREADKLPNQRGRLFWLSAIHMKLGHSKEAEKFIAEMLDQYPYSAFQVASVYGFNDKTSKACDWLEKAYSNRERSFVSLRVNPAFRKFGNEPRFKILLSKINYPD